METRFSKPNADRACSFFEQLLVHTKGAYARQPFTLSGFQADEIIRPLFGEQAKDPDLGEWVRLYSMAWIELGRGNGKSEIMAGIALLLTGADDEEGAEVYGVARDRDQASLVFDVAKRMLELSGLGGGPRSGKPYTIYPTHKRIVYAKTGSFYRVLAADALGNLGQDPHGILFDEVISQPNGELWDALKTGFKRRQPLMVAATTAGADPSSFAYDEHLFSARVAEDPDLDPRRLVVIRSVPKDADWRDESIWKLANPALGDFLRPQILRDELTVAMNNPREERRFRQFRLNQWQSGSLVEAIPYDDWIASGGMVVEDKVVGKRAWGGLVASSVTDLSSICWCFENPEGPGFWVLWRHFLPEDLLSALDDRTNGKATTWQAQGLLTLTEGNVIDIGRHIAQIRADVERFDARELAYDPNGTIGIVQPLIEENAVTVVPIYASTPGASLLDIERLVRTRELMHGANPIATWQVGNLVAKESVGGVLKIDRRASHDSVAGLAAFEMAMRRVLLRQIPKRSVYESRGVQFV